jgi:hypothetical protein
MIDAVIETPRLRQKKRSKAARQPAPCAGPTLSPPVSRLAGADAKAYLW